jgi:putative DNA primase/helicase
MSGSGRNGKGIFIEKILSVLGDYAGPVQSEMLLEQGRARGSGAITPDIMALRGRRLVVASESDEGRHFSPSRLKWITGQDDLVGRNPYDKQMSVFKPSHKLVLLTNNDPAAPGDDFAFWDRVLKVDWPYRFVENPRAADEKKRDLSLRDKINSELPGILAWAVRGCLEWQRMGLDPPGCVLDSVTGYQREQDIIEDFIEACCHVDPGNETLLTPADDLYRSFKTWYQEFHRAKTPTSTWFGRKLGKKFKRVRGRVRFYQGIGLTS